MIFFLHMTDIVHKYVWRYTLIFSGYGLEGNHGTFCPSFIGYCMGRAYINNFKQDRAIFYESCFFC